MTARRLLLLATALAGAAPARPAHAQGFADDPDYKECRGAYDKSRWKDAVFWCAKAAPRANLAEFWFVYGTALNNTSDYVRGVDAWRRHLSMNPNPSSLAWLRAGNAEIEAGHLDIALQPLRTFMTRHGDQPGEQSNAAIVRTRLRYALESPKVRATPRTMKDPVNLGPGINSPHDDYMPQSSPTGAVLYFTSQRRGFPGTTYDKDDNSWGEDIYSVSRKPGGGWGVPGLLPPPVNSVLNDGAPAFTADGQGLIFVGCGRNEGFGSCDLYQAALDGSKWSNPRNLGNVVNGSDWDSQPTISSDGRMIIFTSTRDGGFGGEDLYMIVKDRYGAWATPVNLGDVINTPFDEQSPYLSADNRTLYFSSTGHPGFGKRDLFKTVLDNTTGRWSEPVNLGQPLNSEGDDRYFTIGGSGEVGYFASNRKGGLGGLDLYSIEIPQSMRPQPTVVVSGTVTSSKDKKPIGAFILVEDIDTAEVVASLKSNSETGKYLVVLPQGRNYSVSANHEGYFFYSQKFDVPRGGQYQELTRDIELKPIEKGSRIVLNNIFFETGKAILSPDSKVELQKAVDLLKANPKMVIEVGGHTDNVGRAETNMTLSHERAKAVREALVTGGIAPERLKAKGYGQTSPVASNDTPEGRQANRRTEFVILED